MILRSVLAAVAAGVLIPTATLAAPLAVTASNSEVAVAGPAPDDEAAARRSAAGLVQPPKIGAVFENITDGATVVLRHRASGLVCTAPGVVVVSPRTEIAAFDPARQDGCITAIAGFQNDVMIFPNNRRLDAPHVLDALASDVVKKKPDLYRLHEPARRPKDDSSGPTYVSARLGPLSGVDGGYVLLEAAVVDGWVIVDKVQGSTAQSAAIEIVGQSKITSAVDDVLRTRTPPTPSPEAR